MNELDGTEALVQKHLSVSGGWNMITYSADGTGDRQVPWPLNKDVYVMRSLAWSSVRLAFQSAVEKKGTVIAGPKKLANIRGISYIYSLLWRFGMIKVSGKVEKRLRGLRS